MAWLVFGLFFIHSDHAPWWVYAAFLAGYLVDAYKENALALRDDIKHEQILQVLRRLW